MQDNALPAALVLTASLSLGIAGPTHAQERGAGSDYIEEIVVYGRADAQRLANSASEGLVGWAIICFNQCTGRN